jgi:elongation factor Ts
MSVQELRARTGAGIVSCSQALKEANGDMEKAVLILRKKGETRADGYNQRSTNSGVIGVYAHHDKSVAVLVRVGCETDFVARTQEFQDLANNIAMHVTAANPRVVQRSEIGDSVVHVETMLAREELEKRGMSGEKLEKALKGKVEKVLAERCLLDQPFVVDTTMTVGEAVKAFSSKCGEKIEVKSFVRVSV